VAAETPVGSDRLAGQALPAQGFNAIDDRLRGGPIELLGPRAAVLQAGHAFGLVALDPFLHRARANAYGLTGGLRRLPTENHVDHVLSTERC